MIKIAIFSSGNGSNAENIIRYFFSHHKIQVILVISNNRSALVHERAEKLGVPSYTFPREKFEKTTPVLDLLRENEIDFIVLAGFMLKVPKAILDEYPNKIVNIHPALLPKYGGKGMYGDNVHKAVVEAGETKSGITIHYVNENYDEGSIIFQQECEVASGDKYCDVAQRVHKLEYENYPAIIEQAINSTFGI